MNDRNDILSYIGEIALWFAVGFALMLSLSGCSLDPRDDLLSAPPAGYRLPRIVEPRPIPVYIEIDMRGTV